MANRPVPFVFADNREILQVRVSDPSLFYYTIDLGFVSSLQICTQLVRLIQLGKSLILFQLGYCFMIRAAVLLRQTAVPVPVKVKALSFVSN